MGNFSIPAIPESAVERYTEAYEQGWSPQRKHQLRDFLPPPSHPEYLSVVAELICIDLELSWSSGLRGTLCDYGELTELLRDRSDLLLEVVFEEYRQRTLSGENIDAVRFAAQNRIDPGSFSTLVCSHDVTVVDREFDTHSLPKSGDHWREFEIVKEIGRGVMSRVFLARQTTLSQRQVVLKFAPNYLLEAEKLALLQHPNIVPVYSVYDEGDFHVFCMPYLGTVTLDLVAQQTEVPRAERDVLRWALRVSDSLQHAHRRGVLHNDIKPSNVLIDQFGEPQLLDFNLSIGLPHKMATNVGGTLSYMSPEALCGFETNRMLCDERSDLYSLAIVFYEVLSGKLLFPRPSEQITHTLAAAQLIRTSVAPRLQELTASPGTKSILQKCLEVDSSQRYQSADDLSEDIGRHLNNRPLRFAANTSLLELVEKWCRRHPRSASLSTIAMSLLLTITIAGLLLNARGEQLANMQAADQLARFLADANHLLPSLSAVGLGAGDEVETLAKADTLLRRYLTPEGDWLGSLPLQRLTPENRTQAVQTIAKLLIHVSMGQVLLAKTDGSEPGSASQWDELSQVLLQQHNAGSEVANLRFAVNTPISRSIPADLSTMTAEQLHVLSLALRREGKIDVARRLLDEAVTRSRGDVAKLFDLSVICQQLGDWSEAEAHLNVCLTLAPDVSIARFVRGTARYSLGRHPEAIEDFDHFLTTSPNHTFCLLHRALARMELGEYGKALEDLNRAIDADFDTTRVFVIRSRVHHLLGNHLASLADMQSAMRAKPRDELDYVARGVARMSREPKLASEDFRAAIKLNPRSYSARRNLAFVLSEQLGNRGEAITLLDQMLTEFPRDVQLIAGRGVILAREGALEVAIDAAKEVTNLNPDARNLLQAASIYALAAAHDSKWSEKAIDLLSQALQRDVTLEKVARVDADLKAICQLKEFQSLCDAAALLTAK